MTTARRLAAILAIDFMGCSRLMGEDEARAGQSHLASLKTAPACRHLHDLMAMERPRETAGTPAS